MAAMMTKLKEVKVTICPPAEQDAFFQETQFDAMLPGRGGEQGATQSGNRGTNPITYWNGGYAHQRQGKAPKYGSKAHQTKLRKAEKELEGHENKDAILKILRSGS
jgi:hypothetical protein